MKSLDWLKKEIRKPMIFLKIIMFLGGSFWLDSQLELIYVKEILSHVHIFFIWGLTYLPSTYNAYYLVLKKKSHILIWISSLN